MMQHARIARRASGATLALLIASFAAYPGAAAPAVRAAEVAVQPFLATPDQVQAERELIALLRDPDLKVAQRKVEGELALTAIGRTRDGEARIKEVVAQWTNSLIFKELVAERSDPVILWGTDDTPRTWLGYTIAGVGTSGDNPDHIYRSSGIDGAGRYEIVGQFDPKRRPAQFVISVSPSQSVANMKAPPTNAAGMGGLTTVLTDRDIKVAPDGSFRITLGGDAPAGGGTHIALQPGAFGVGFRDVLSDWDQQASRLTIRRLDQHESKPFDRAALKQRVVEGLSPYVKLWSAFPESWFDGLKPNTISGPVPREGGWGYLAGLRFQLKPDEAAIVTTTRGDAQYQGIQVIDPWMIAGNGRKRLTSFNPAQAKANADGSHSFVIAARDPGTANWLDTGGLHDGFAVLRWQNLPAGAKGDALLREFKVIKLADAAKQPGIAKITPSERKAQVAEREGSYTNRTR